MKQEDFSDITATAKHQFRDQYAREGYQLQKVLQLNKERIREIESIAKVFEVDPSEAINTNVSVEDFKRGIETQK
ncbi:hypothetical protein MJN51_41050, partial [Salmonella enterica subsp. enterica serovar Kentucky]|nr:hypothetical protein [Salmonella enterica subsp. enterica serovar Kentucky]